MSTSQNATEQQLGERKVESNEAQTQSEQPNVAQRPRGISNPNDVANLVLMQIDTVSSKKDELTIAIKGLTDISKQLARAYGEHTKTILELKNRVATLEKN